MNVRICARPGCGNLLQPGRRLKNFCTYACRGQFKALEATGHRTGLKCSKKPSRKGVTDLKTAVCRWFQLLQNKLLHLSARSLEQVGCWLADGGGLARRLKAAMACQNRQPNKRTAFAG
jgi:hypothetical protein